MEEYKPLTIPNWAVEDRPREKLLAAGIQSLSDAELIAILIGSGTKSLSAVDLARQILYSAGNNLNKLGRYTVHDLTQIKGIGKAKAISILAALELGRRRNGSTETTESKVTGSTDVFSLMAPLLSDLPYEEFWVVFLNRSNRIISRHKISQGGITGTVTDIRLILRSAIENRATSLILCHNHPSGNLQPSEADISITRRMKDSSSLMDIALLDHIIIAGRNYFSFADENLI